MNGFVGFAGVVPIHVGPGTNWNTVPLTIACASDSAAAVMFGELSAISKVDGLAAVMIAFTRLKMPSPFVVPVIVTCCPNTGAVPEIKVKL